MRSLYEEYRDIINNKDKWIRTDASEDFNEYHIDNIFLKPHTENYMKLLYFNEVMISMIKRMRFKEGRELHTLSAYFFGILLKEKLRISTKSFPRIDNDYHKSFIYFWSLACLTHDFTFADERNVSIVENCPTAEKYADYKNIKYNLLNDSEYGELLKNYYLYAYKERGKADHGITCGMMLYDELMKRYYYEKELQNNTIFITRDPWKISKSFPKYALTISEAIARHNIWVAEENTIDIYEKYHLSELIPSDSRFRKISYNEKDSLLFLLGLVDTLEPVKSCYNDGANSVYDILNNVDVDFNKDKKLMIIKSEKYFNKKILDRWSKISNWLDTSVIINYEEYSVTIMFKYESITDRVK